MIWLAVAVLLGLWHPKIRNSIGGLTKAVFDPLLIRHYVGFLLWLGFALWQVTCFGLWATNLWAPTVVWAFVACFATPFQLLETDSSAEALGRLIRQAFAVSLLLEALASFAVFSLPTELAIVLLGIFVAVLSAAAEANAETRQVASALGRVSLLLGLALVLYSSYALWTQAATLSPRATGIQFGLPAMLYLVTAPYFFVLFLYIQYDHLYSFLRTRLSDAEAAVATRIALQVFHARPALAHKWAKGTPNSVLQDRYSAIKSAQALAGGSGDT